MEIQAEQDDMDQEIENIIPQQPSKGVVRVGLFVIMGLAATIYLLYLLTDPATFRGRYKVTTTVENVMGLRKGDPVQMRGVNVGRVHDFDLTSDANNVVVILEIEGQWRIPEGSRTQIGSTGLTSPKTVMIVPGDGPGDISSGTNIQGKATKGLFDDTETLGEKGGLALDQIAALLSDSNIAAVNRSFQDLQMVMGGLVEILGSQRQELKGIISSLDQAASGLADVTGPELRERVSSTVSQVDSISKILIVTSERLGRATASLETVLGRMERGEGTLGQLSVNDSLYVSLNEAVTSVSLLVEDLRTNPGRYINLSIF